MWYTIVRLIFCIHFRLWPCKIIEINQDFTELQSNVVCSLTCITVKV